MGMNQFFFAYKALCVIISFNSKPGYWPDEFFAVKSRQRSGFSISLTMHQARIELNYQ
jgi:hypothetical protein